MLLQVMRGILLRSLSFWPFSERKLLCRSLSVPALPHLTAKAEHHSSFVWNFICSSNFGHSAQKCVATGLFSDIGRKSGNLEGSN